MQRHRCYALALIGQLFNPRARDARGAAGASVEPTLERAKGILRFNTLLSTQEAGRDRQDVAARSCVRSRAVGMERPAGPLPIGTENASKTHESCTNAEKIEFGEMIHVKANVFSLSINKNSAFPSHPLNLVRGAFRSRFRNANEMKN